MRAGKLRLQGLYAGMHSSLGMHRMNSSQPPPISMLSLIGDLPIPPPGIPSLPSQQGRAVSSLFGRRVSKDETGDANRYGIVCLSICLLTILLLSFCLTQCSEPPPPEPVTPIDTTFVPKDTTSHRFTWTIDTLYGPVSHCRDVYAVSDDHVLIAGDWDEYDSTGEIDYSRSGNLVEIINGQKHLLRISTSEGYSTANSCFSTKMGEVWIGHALPVHRTDTGWAQYLFPGPYFVGGVLAIWGRENSFDMYFACGEGIVRIKDGIVSQLITIRGNPGMNFGALWGMEDGDVMVRGYKDGSCYLYRVFPDGHVQEVMHNPSGIGSVWAYNGVWYIVDNRHVRTSRDGEEWSISHEFKYWTYRIRGNNENDIFFSQSRYGVIHWNGSTLENIYHGEFGTFPTRQMAVSANKVFLVAMVPPNQHVVLLTGTRAR